MREVSESIFVTADSKTQRLDNENVLNDEIFCFEEESLYQPSPKHSIYETQQESEIFVECTSSETPEINECIENELYLTEPKLPNNICSETQFHEPIDLFYFEDDFLGENGFEEFIDEDKLCQDMPDDEG